MELIPDWLSRRAVDGSGLAALSDSQAWSFATLDNRAHALAGEVAALGVAPGSRVAALLSNGLPYLTLIHALIKLGAILVPINIRLAAPEIAWQLDDVQATILIYDDANRGLAAAAISFATALSSHDIGGLIERSGITDAEPERYARRFQIDLQAVQAIIYTSGTTGRPKGVLLTYGNHWWSAVGSALNLGTQADDRWLAVLPLFHVGGLSIVMRSVIYGVPLIIHPHFDPAAVNSAIEQLGVTLISVVSVMLTRMLDHRAGQMYPPSLRAVLLGGGPAPLPLLQRCVKHGLPVVQTYGMTETASQAVTLHPRDALRKQGSTGQPLLPFEVRIEDNGVVVPSGMAGEIVVRGPSVTRGYADRPTITAERIRDGWLHTGDLGYLDVEGYLFVLDRRDDLIITGGENVYPAEVESVLLAHPAVAEAGVVGLPDPTWGQRVFAAVVLRPAMPTTSTELLAWCSVRLARYKTPSLIVTVAALPHNATGKLMRATLRSNWAQLVADPSHT
ncbi:MAG: o-succinylbenzoate--CoA ligase [Herpetosiphon sp.]